MLVKRNDYILDITIDDTDITNTKYSITGLHDGFPAYEVYIGAKLIYKHDPLKTGEVVSSLFDPIEHDVSIINQPL